MPSPSIRPWSDNPYAPRIPHVTYVAEKANFSGNLIGTISYGIVVVFFFQCIATLLNPAKRTKGDITWGLVVHTVLMFSFVTINTAITLYLQLFSYVGNREFPGDSVVYPGPLAYQLFISSGLVSNIPVILFQLNQLLADGLLLYRCHIIYGMNYWVIAFPCLVYLASFASGIVLSVACFRPEADLRRDRINLHHLIATNFSTSVALNGLLTLMIVVRLVLHNRNFRKAIGAQATAGGFYLGIVAILVESFTLYSASLFLFMVLNATGSPTTDFFNQILPLTQVIAPFLIVQRVATRRALESDDVTSGKVGSIRFRSHGESTSRDGTIPDGDFIDSTDSGGEITSETGTGNEDAVEDVPQ